MITLVDQVKIYEDKKIEIKFKYQNAFEKALSYIESISHKEFQDKSLLEVV